jgi:hypothetical protein
VRQQVLRELRATPLHQAIQPLLAQHLAQQQQQEQQVEHSCLSEKLTVLLLQPEPSAGGAAAVGLDPQQLLAWKHLLDAAAVSILDGEVGYLRQQLLHIEDVLQVTGGGSSSTVSFSDSCNSCTGGYSDAAAAASAAAAAAGEAVGVSCADSIAVGVSELQGASPCSSCSFQHDCSLKGCVNTRGEVEVQLHAGDTRMALLQQQQQQQEFSSHGCCSSGHGEETSVQHGCCS